jgi:glycosyltransferase involved in cell wall biosynthesis
MVAPSLRILGGQAIQADRLLRQWDGDSDVEAWLVPVNPVPPRLLRPLARVKYVRTVVTELTYAPLLLRELRRADVVHVFSAAYTSFLLAPLPAVLAAFSLHKPVVLNYRSGEAPAHLARSAVARKVLASVERNVVPSPFLAGVFAEYGIPATVIPNVVDLNRFGYVSRPRIAPRFVSTRNFEPLYNVACTLRAFGRIQERYPNATLTLVGCGSEEASLHELTAALGLRGVTFTGAIPPVDIPRIYAEHDVYIQSPDIDNTPTSIIEAYASGLPVVSTDAGGIPFILRDGVDGLLAPVDDHVALATQALRLLDDPAMAAQLSATARQFCDRCTWSAVRPLWLALYEGVAAPRSWRVPAPVPPTAHESRR